MLNSLSHSSDILGMPGSSAPHRVVAVDEAATVFRFDLRHIGWSKNDWEKVVRHYPYGLTLSDGAGQSVRTLTTSRFPFMRADWFVFATSQAPLYHELLGIDELLADLEKKLGVDRISNIQNFKAARAAFGNSLVSVNNRLIERHAFRGGYYHISYDFFRNDGRGNLFDFPLGPSGAFRDFAFQHDGGEVIYTLPNGFQAYVLVTASGKRLRIAPASIVHDNSMSQVGSVILNGISCISCHYDGMKPENRTRLDSLDELREQALANTRRFDARTRDIIGRLYPPRDEFVRLIESDRRSWRMALQQAGLTETGAIEPVRALFDSFVRNLDLEIAAAEFGVSPDELLQSMSKESETRQLANRFAKRGMQRQLFVAEFQRIAALAGFGEPRKFESLLVPYFGHNPDAKPAVKPVANAAASSHMESDLLTANNQPARLRVTIGSSNKAFTDEALIPLSIRANAECFITVLSIDPRGKVTSLLPNKRHHESDGRAWWSPVTLPANRTLKIPSKELPFRIVAEPPHGATTIRVIATRGKPLKLRLTPAMIAGLNENGVTTLGHTKGAGVRFGQDAHANNPGLPSVPQQITDGPISNLYAPNDWATTEWTFLTRSR